MRRKNNLAPRDSNLLQNFAGMAMCKYAVRGKIVCRIHEVCFGRWNLTGATDAALGVGNYSVVEIDETRCGKRLKSQNDRGCVTARIGDRLCRCDLLAMQLGHSIDSKRLRGRGEVGALVGKGIDGAVRRLRQTPSGAQID